ncbi:leucine-rich repeat domain-containing protein [Bacillus cereus group sp. MYBK95-2]|uniref:leucine-rich repeat domain-containing protein n=1 Tax=Bacillus cereus group sp. MYBK95-2 TaxID=3450599 RepID=UPI003F7987EB
MMFPIGEQPKIIKYLKTLENIPDELAIDGKTKNLEKLASFSEINKLWIFTVNQKQFETILNYIKPKILYIYEMRVEDLSPLEKLTDIEELHMCWNTKATTLWDLTQNIKLISLSIEDFSKLDNVEPLIHCENLKKLNLSGGIWKSLNIYTLEPLKYLANLKELTLMNIKVKDESLKPLSYLYQLQKLNISNQFPTEEYARLSVILKNTKCDFFQPYINFPDDSIDDKNIMVVGKRKPFLNSDTDLKKIKKYEEQFKIFQDKYKNILVDDI